MATNYDLSHISTLADLHELANRAKAAANASNVLEVVKVNGVALAIADKMVDILVQTGTANGSIKVNGTDVSVAGLAALAYKAEVSESDLATALATKLNAKADQTAVDTLIGNVSGDDAKSVRTISAEEVAKIVAGADTSYDTLKEIAEWIMSDTTGAAKMANDISALKTKLTLGTHEVGGEQVEYTTVQAYVEAVVASLNLSNYYTKSETDTELAKKVDKETGKSLLADTEITRLAGMSTGANKVEASQTNGNIKIDNVETNVYTEPSDVIHGTVATSTEVAAMLDEVFGS